MDLGLQGKVALVTGGASGIGAATVRLLASEGVSVAFADRNESAGLFLASELSQARRECHFISAELTKEEGCARAVTKTLEAFGALDILINNAGVNDGVGLEQSPVEFMSSLQKNL